MKSLFGMICLFVVGACSSAAPLRVLGDKEFEAAKKACGATEAYIFEADGKRGVSFKGVASDSRIRQKQAICLISKLRGTDARFVGFLSEFPRR
jgi:hypothetical protein